MLLPRYGTIDVCFDLMQNDMRQHTPRYAKFGEIRRRYLLMRAEQVLFQGQGVWRPWNSVWC